MKRNKYPTRTIRLIGLKQLETVRAILDSPDLPLDAEHPLEIIIREEQRRRKLDQNGLMWVDQLAAIAAQAYVDGRTYSAEIWHEFFKELFLPEEYTDGITCEGYAKYDYMPNGKRVLVGSTTKLTMRGFADYLTEIEAYGANLGVMFTIRNEK